MPDRRPNVAVLIVCYNHRDDVIECLEAVLRSRDASISRRVVVVDNASTDRSADWVEEHFADVDLVRSETNDGFAGGNNRGWDHIHRTYPDTEYLVLLNPDTVVTDGWLAPLVGYLESHRDVGSVQPKIMLHPQTDRINTVGNRCHFLGFGFVTGFGQADEGQYDTPRTIDFASGCAVMVRANLLEQTGLFDDEMFMYLEDVDLSWKLRMIGYETVFLPDSMVYHKHDPEKALRHFYHLERNRWWLLLSYYKWGTLLLLGPAIDWMELGTLWFALRHGMLRQKFAVYRELFRAAHQDRILEKRRWVQSHRTISDRHFMTRFAGRIDFPPINRGLLRYVGNPLLACYWWLVKRLIMW